MDYFRVSCGAQSKGELSTSDGSSIPGTSTAPAEVPEIAEVAEPADDDDDDGMSLGDLEKECEAALTTMMNPIHPSQKTPPTPSASVEGKGKGQFRKLGTRSDLWGWVDT